MPSKRVIPFVLLVLASYTGILSAQGPERTQEVDHLALAALMIHDGRFEKAKTELSLVDTSANNFDAARYYTIRGVLDSKTDRFRSAIKNYLKAIRATKAKTFEPPGNDEAQRYLFSVGSSASKKSPDPAPGFDAKKIKSERLEKLHIYLSQAYYQIKDYAKTVKHLDLAGAKGKDRAALFALRAECYWKIGRKEKAIDALNEGLGLFPDEAALLLQKYHYFAEIGFYQSAIKFAKKYISVTNADAGEYVILAQLLIEADLKDEAIEILEEARARFPKNPKLDLLLGHVYMKYDMNYTAAHLFEKGASKDRQYVSDAVEMFRRNKDYSHAIFLTTRMNDKVEKLKQEVAIFLDRGEFEKVIGLEDDLERHNILNDDNMRYALAYSYYMAKDYPKAELHLKKIQDSSLFKKGTTILENIERCRENALECF